jgi:hypothetical protein
LYHFLNLCFLKSILAETANGALEVLCNLFPRRAWGDSLAGLSNLGIEFIAAGQTCLTIKIIPIL